MANVKNKKSNTIVCCILMLLGIFSTMPILEIGIGKHYVTCFTVLFGCSILALLFVNNKKTIKVGNPISLFEVWMIIAVISSFCGYLFFIGDELWCKASVSYVPKLILYILFAVLWSNKRTNEMENSILTGFIFGCVLNCLWATLDGICYYVWHFSLNNYVFSDYIIRNNVRHGQASIILTNGMIRATGFNIDPAHIGFIAPLVIAYALYEKKWLILIIGIAGTIFSASSTALVTIMAILLININIFVSIKVRITPKKVISFLLSSVGIVILLIVSIDKWMPLVQKAIGLFANRINEVYVNSNTMDPRTVYLLFFLTAVCNAGAINILGSGLGTASYPYVKDAFILNNIGYSEATPYDPEMTYIAYYFDTGIIGCLIYIYCLYILHKYSRKKLESKTLWPIIFFGIESTIVSALFYHYIIFAPQMILIIVGLSSISRKKLVDNEYGG